MTHLVQILLDQSRASFAPGETISGRVVVRTAHADQVEGLNIEVHGCTTDVGGRQGLSVITKERLFEGAWEAGRTYVYPFSIHAPRCVSAYMGRQFSLGSRLAAVAGLSSQGRRRKLRTAPAAELPISIDRDPRPVVIVPFEKSLSGTEQWNLNLGCSLIAMLLGTAGLAWLGLKAAGLLPFTDDNFDQWSFIAVPICATLVLGGVIGLIKNGLRIAARGRTGSPLISAETRHAPAGPSVELTFRFLADAGVTRGSAKIEVQEVIQWETQGDGHSKTQVERARLGVLEVPLEGGNGSLRGTVPGHAIAHLPPCFGNLNARVEWRMCVHVEIPGCPDYRNVLAVAAAPGGEGFLDTMWTLLL